MNIEQRKKLLKGKMPHFTVRLPRDTAESLLSESSALGRSISETIRLVAGRHVTKEEDQKPIIEKLSQLHLSLHELGRDLETVTRLLLVALHIASEDEAKEWCRNNLKVGK